MRRLGLFYQPTTFRSDLHDIPEGIPQFYRVRRAGLMAHVVVIGAGIVGAATAVELLRDGHRVTILEPGEPGGEQAASYGNGTLLNPSSVIPMSSPGIWRKVPGWLADPLGPLAIRWRYLPRLLPWLTRFLRAGATEAQVAATARALRPLVLNAPELHRRLAEEAGVGELITRQGDAVRVPEPRRVRGRGDWPGGCGARTACAGWSCRPMNCASASRRWTGATRSACWWRRTASAAILAPMWRRWCVMRWRRGRSCGGRRALGFRIEGGAPARGAHGGGRDRGGPRGDRGGGVVECARRRGGRSRAAGDRARLPRGDRGPRHRAAVSGDAERRQDGVRDDAAGTAAGRAG